MLSESDWEIARKDYQNSEFKIPSDMISVTVVPCVQYYLGISST